MNACMLVCFGDNSMVAPYGPKSSSITPMYWGVRTSSIIGLLSCGLCRGGLRHVGLCLPCQLGIAYPRIDLNAPSVWNKPITGYEEWMARR
jgi:hypothetical protein